MTKIFWLSLIAVLASTTSGCMFDWEDDYSYEEEPYGDSAYAAPDYDTETTIDLDDGYLAGDLGEYEGFSAPTYQATQQDWAGNSTVELHGGQDYWVMSRLEVNGSLKHRDLAPGAVLVFDDETRGWSDTGEGSDLFVSSIGCSGPEQGNYTYDGPADRVVVEVEQGPTTNDRVMHFQAEYAYEGGTQVVEGSFGYTVY